jgi:hypothetical protein
VDGQLVTAGGDGAVALESADAAFRGVALLLQVRAECWRAAPGAALIGAVADLAGAPDRAGERLREIGDAIGLTSISSVGYQLSALQRKGYLHRDGRRPRTTDLCLPSRPAVPPEQSYAAEAGQAGDGPDIPSREPVYVPLVGRIVADGPILAVSAEDLRIDPDDAQSCRARRIGRPGRRDPS